MAGRNKSTGKPRKTTRKEAQDARLKSLAEKPSAAKWLKAGAHAAADGVAKRTNADRKSPGRKK